MIIWLSHSVIQPTNKAAAFIEDLLYADTALGTENTKGNMLSLKGKHICGGKNIILAFSLNPGNEIVNFILDHLGTTMENRLKVHEFLCWESSWL